jgi:hypothetical protein
MAVIPETNPFTLDDLLNASSAALLERLTPS